MHLNHFWVPSRITGLETYNFNGVEYHNLYAEMQLHFKDIMVVSIYTLGCISLAWHLLHGFYSAFQTLGLASFKYKALIKSVGIIFSILIPLLFASMPIAFFLDLIK
jgi:succinate dehydrogenase / fumarate reductase cytochrome b subunit